MTMTMQQIEAVERLYERDPDLSPDVEQFFQRVEPVPHDTHVMLPWCGMWVGIEPDGYTHT